MIKIINGTTAYGERENDKNSRKIVEELTTQKIFVRNSRFFNLVLS